MIQSLKTEYLRWREGLRGQRNFVLKVLFLGILSGFPQILFFSLLPLWLKTIGMSFKEIALIGMVGTFFAFNWVLAPLMDSITAFNLERRRFWLLVSQIFIIIMCLALAFTGVHLAGLGFGLMSLFITLIAFGSAAQDVSVDALRIELVPEGREDLLAFASSLGVIGWYTGYNMGGALGLHLFGLLNGANAATAPEDWRTVYFIMAGVMTVLMIATQMVFRHRKPAPRPPLPEKPARWFADVFVKPFTSFVESKGWKVTLMLLGFLLMFKLGEAFLGRLSIVFYTDIGYSDAEIANYVKAIGWGATVVFIFFSGLMAGRFGVWRGMMVGGIAMASTNLLFSLIALVQPPSVLLLLFTVISDNFTTAFATVSTVTFISALCDRHYTATQYALFASLTTAGRTLLASSAGWLLEDVFHKSWVLFFIATAVMVIPSLVILWFMRHQPLFALSQQEVKK